MKEENIKGEYQRKVDKSLIPTCNIMGVNIAAINMNWLLKYLDENLSDIKGDYICVSNVHTTVTSYENAAYCAVQNGGLMAIPDGGPLSSVGRKRGYSDMDRTTGPSLMGEIFKISAEKGYRHYFYGSTEETLKLLEEKLQENYPGIQIAGMYTVAKASQGLADYVIKNFAPEKRKIAVSFDSRIKSDVFAKVAAGVFAANGIKVAIYSELMPTPCLSFAVRYLGCAAGVMVTASHNPAKYNGYAP